MPDLQATRADLLLPMEVRLPVMQDLRLTEVLQRNPVVHRLPMEDLRPETRVHHRAPEVLRRAMVDLLRAGAPLRLADLPLTAVLRPAMQVLRLLTEVHLPVTRVHRLPTVGRKPEMRVLRKVMLVRPIRARLVLPEKGMTMTAIMIIRHAGTRILVAMIRSGGGDHLSQFNIN